MLLLRYLTPVRLLLTLAFSQILTPLLQLWVSYVLPDLSPPI